MNLFSKSEDPAAASAAATATTPGAAGAPAFNATTAPTDTDAGTTQEKTELGKLTAFVKEDPQNTYFIDGEREVARSSVCRNTQQGRTCLQLLISSKVMFQQMQKMVSIQ